MLKECLLRHISTPRTHRDVSNEHIVQIILDPSVNSPDKQFHFIMKLKALQENSVTPSTIEDQPWSKPTTIESTPRIWSWSPNNCQPLPMTISSCLPSRSRGCALQTRGIYDNKINKFRSWGKGWLFWWSDGGSNCLNWQCKTYTSCIFMLYFHIFTESHVTLCYVNFSVKREKKVCIFYYFWTIY